MVALTPGASLAWQIASIEAHESRHQFIEKEHLFIGACSLEKVLAADGIRLDPAIRRGLDMENGDLEASLRELELSPAMLRRCMRQLIGKGTYERAENVIHRSEDCKMVFSESESIVGSGSYISALHLLAAILEHPGPVIEDVLNGCGVRAPELRENILKRLSAGHDYYGGLTAGEQPAGQGKVGGYLDKYGRDITAEAKSGKLGPFSGRQKELMEIIGIFSRRFKNNPVLVGSAGVGKTSIVEALAVQIAEGKVPAILSGKRIIELNVGALVGGTRYRGDFEDRMMYIIAEARARPEVVLFIDEVHNIVGAGRGEGMAMDAGSLLKSAFTHGDVRCIGATTAEEYRKYIESDPALERRFDKVTIEEPGRDEALEMLRSIRPKLEEHHGVKVTDEALESAVDLSIRFDSGHHLPDKAIDLVDRAASRIRLPRIETKGKAVVETDGGAEGMVTGVAIARTVSEKTGVPVEVVLGNLKQVNGSWLLGMEPFLKSRVLSQDEAIGLVCQRLLMAYSGIKSRRGPLAVLLFLGPTGIGKTETAKSLAEFLFGGHSSLIRLDMSEYKEEHSISKLIGSPPGYIGHDEEGQLTGKLQSRPYSVVLLDDVEKANPKVFDLFLQAFDEGRITDAKGRVADARNAIFIMTSNIGSEEHVGVSYHEMEEAGNTTPNSSKILKRNLMGNQNKEKFLSERDPFRPEFINRIDEIIVFRSLSRDDAAMIVKPMLEEVKKDLKERYGIVLHAGEDVERSIAALGYSPEYGVRELRRTMERSIQVPLSRLIISGELYKHKEWQALCGDDGISIKPVELVPE
jgi:ATP-dependent Clp protease ATP-binding subunit ClpC